MTDPIWFLVETTPSPEPTGGRDGDDIGGGFGSPTDTAKSSTHKRVPLDAAALKAQLNGLLQILGDISDRSAQQNGLQLDEVELAVEITGEGQVNFLGNSGKLGNKGAIKLKFKRATV